MKQYIGTKIINAKPMSKLEYNDFRGWELPDDENGTDEGYLVEYLDGGKPNTTEYKGYVSWSPKEQFDNAYKASGNLSFGNALEYLKRGYKVARKGWNGKGMFLTKQFCQFYPDNLGETFDEDSSELLEGVIIMFTATGIFVAWSASQTDMFAEDWEILK